MFGHVHDAVRGVGYFSVSMASNGGRGQVAKVAYISPECIALLSSFDGNAHCVAQRLYGAIVLTLFQGSRASLAF
jgi:hypothetical protein